MWPPGCCGSSAPPPPRILHDPDGAADEVVVPGSVVGGLVSGDWVALELDGIDPVSGVRLPRRTVVRRAVASGRSEEQLLAANVDVVGVVVSLVADPDLGRFERFLALAWDSGAIPLAVLTKADLVDDATAVAADVAAAAPGVDVLVVSAVTGEGLAGLQEVLRAEPHRGAARAVGRREVVAGQRARR